MGGGGGGGGGGHPHYYTYSKGTNQKEIFFEHLDILSSMVQFPLSVWVLTNRKRIGHG